MITVRDARRELLIMRSEYQGRVDEIVYHNHRSPIRNLTAYGGAFCTVLGAILSVPTGGLSLGISGAGLALLAIETYSIRRENATEEARLMMFMVKIQSCDIAIKDLEGMPEKALVGFVDATAKEIFEESELESRLNVTDKDVTATTVVRLGSSK